jgi:hypothetical protein
MEDIFAKLDQACSRLADGNEVEKAWAIRGIIDFLQEQLTETPLAWENDPYYRRARQLLAATELW